MKKIKGYANYGVLAHEKRIQFTVSASHAHAKTSDEIEIEIPDNWEISENSFGEILLSKDGKTYRANDIIISVNDSPVLSWYDGDLTQKITLSWCEI